MKKVLTVLCLLIGQSAIAQFDIGHRTITYNDPARSNRAIECEIYYPGVSAGDNVDVVETEFPIIVFGHGFAMQVGAYPNWREEFVPEGYILIFPTTEGSFVSPNHGEFGQDLQFLVTKMQAEGGSAASPFFGHISERAAIMGHSMGGGATILGASGFSDVDCIVGLAPAETNPSAIAAASNVSAPAMIISGTSDGVTPPADHHIPIYNALGSDCKYFVPIENGSHCYFASNTVTCTLGEIIPGSLPAEDQRQSTYAVCHPWFEYFLKDDCESWDDFQTALSTDPNLGTIDSDCDVVAPIISDNNGNLESDNQPNYQWYLNGEEIPGATQQTFTYTQSGMYQAGSVLLGNCPTLSNEVQIQIIGIDDDLILRKFENGFQIFSNSQLNDITLKWYDSSGRLLQQEDRGTVPANSRLILDQPEINGLKVLLLQSNETVKTWKFH